jgi:hypothetical protein
MSPSPTQTRRSLATPLSRFAFFAPDPLPLAPPLPARMFAGFTEYFHHEIRKPVDDERLVAETFGRVDHAKHLDHALDAIEAA